VPAFGNRGSASQASHFAGELLGRYAPGPRRGLAAVALARDRQPIEPPAHDAVPALIERGSQYQHDGDIADLPTRFA
jgi:hypothetical protein